MADFLDPDLKKNFMNAPDVFKSAKILHDQGKITEALAGLREALRRGQLDPAETERAEA